MSCHFTFSCQNCIMFYRGIVIQSSLKETQHFATYFSDPPRSVTWIRVCDLRAAVNKRAKISLEGLCTNWCVMKLKPFDLAPPTFWYSSITLVHPFFWLRLYTLDYYFTTFAATQNSNCQGIAWFPSVPCDHVHKLSHLISNSNIAQHELCKRGLCCSLSARAGSGKT